MQGKWRFAWKFSFRASGLLLALVAGALVVARIAIALGHMEQAESTFGSFEVVIPLIVGLHTALLFAPDDEPALELLLAAPRPPVYLIYERLAALIGLQGGLALVLSLLAVMTAGTGEKLLDVVLVWLPPSVCIVGLCLAATLYARRMAFGVLTAIALCVAMAFGREVILPMFPNLWFMIFYLDPRTVTTEQYFLNRLFLVAVGLVGIGLVLYRMRDTEQLLGLQEVKNG
ncbi:MAG: hypothetical protein GC204_16900 [Chloroflexi bacterium]|nr:hypothetical protein [Chloroflexota bacterium]